MRRILFLLMVIAIAYTAQAQKLDSIYFNLYTDSLKKGFYNYINVDGKYSNGNWMPLDTSTIVFTANTGHFKGNDLFIDSSYMADSVLIKAIVKADPKLWKQVVIYIRKRGFDEPLKTDEQILDEMRRKKKNGR